jgi:hypothetical protein
MLVLAHPLHPDWPVRQRHRDNGGVRAGIVGAVVTVAAGAFDMDAVHLVLRHRQHVRDGVTERVNALAMRPDGHARAVEQADRA